METKVCKTCKVEKDISEYNVSSRKKNMILHHDCKECTAKYARDYRQSRRDYVSEYKLKRGCMLCGFIAKHTCQLDLHHVDPSTKTYKGDHKSYDAGWSLERIDAELEKCIVICKNCHALENYNEGHWRNKYTDISMR